jgi:hypothetical protein
MTKIIGCNTTGIHADFSRSLWNKLFFFLCHSIIYIHKNSLFFI